MADKKEQGPATKRPTAQKRMIQSLRRAAENRAYRSQVRTALRAYQEAIASKKADASALLNQIYSLYDRGVKKGVYKANTASRSKSRLSAHLAK
jgi:small subunit ribosomal protein S20